MNAMTMTAEELSAQWAQIQNSADINLLTLFIEECDKVRIKYGNSLGVGQEDIRKLNERVRGATRGGGRLPSQEYDSICRKQMNLRNSMRETESQLSFVNNLLRSAKATKLAVCMANPVAMGHRGEAIPDIIIGLIKLAEKYECFAGDETRISSMRTMAARCATDLRNLASGKESHEGIEP